MFRFAHRYAGDCRPRPGQRYQARDLQVELTTGDQPPATQFAAARMREVDTGARQHALAVDFGLDQPDDVCGQRTDLICVECNTGYQFETVTGCRSAVSIRYWNRALSLAIAGSR